MASNETATFNVFSYDGTPSFYYNSKMTSRRLQQARDLAAEIMKDRIREADKLQSNYTAMMETLEREERAMQNDVQEQEKKVQILTIMMVIDKDTMRNMEALENETMERLDVEIWERRARWIEMEEYAEIVDEVRELERLTAEIEERRTRMEEMKEKHASKLEYLQQMQQELHQAREHAAAKMNERIREAQNHPYISYLRYASSCQSSADIAHCGLTTYGNNSNTVEREEKRGRKRRQYVEERINRRTKRVHTSATSIS